jgi:hypothetical protein
MNDDPLITSRYLVLPALCLAGLVVIRERTLALNPPTRKVRSFTYLGVTPVIGKFSWPPAGDATLRPASQPNPFSNPFQNPAAICN